MEKAFLKQLKVEAKSLSPEFNELYKQFVGGCEFPADFAISPRFYPELLKVFRAVSPLVEFLNHAMLLDGDAPGRRISRAP